jgi:lipoyl(octanoyl) transferase
MGTDSVPETGLCVEWLGRVPYAEALALQEARVRERADDRRGDGLILLEHPPVITLGRSANEKNLLADPADLARRGIEIHRVGRGGDVTYHAPGQLVGYLIARLDRDTGPDVHRFLRTIEDCVKSVCENLGVPARTLEGRTGVFVDRARTALPGGPERKIASIGVGVRRWVSYHGFALNVDLDIAGFDDIVPCGLADVEMTSLVAEGTVAEGDLAGRVRASVRSAFCEKFGVGS